MSFFKKIGQWLAKIWKGIKPVGKKAVSIGVKITDAMKNFDLEHPGAIDLITSLTHGTGDDEAVAKVREKLPEIMVELRLVDATLSLTDPQEIVAAGVKVIQQLSGDYRITFLNSLAIIISRVAADGHLDIDDALYIIKWWKDNNANEEVNTEVN